MQTGGDWTLWHFFPEGEAPSTPRPYFMDRQKRGQKLLSMAVQEKISKRGFHKGQGTYPWPKGHKFCWFSPAAGQLATNCASLLRTENSGLSTNRKKSAETARELVTTCASLPSHPLSRKEWEGCVQKRLLTQRIELLPKINYMNMFVPKKITWIWSEMLFRHQLLNRDWLLGKVKPRRSYACNSKQFYTILCLQFYACNLIQSFPCSFFFSRLTDGNECAEWETKRALENN